MAINGLTAPALLRAPKALFTRLVGASSTRKRRPASAITSHSGANHTQGGPRHLLNSRKKRLMAGLSLAAMAVAFAALGISSLSSRGAHPYDNAIWLDSSWTWAAADSSRLDELASQLQQHHIGTVYAYASTLDINNRWTGGRQGADGFMESWSQLSSLVAGLRQKRQDLRIMAWIEIWTHLDPVDGYRLDDPVLRQSAADFSQLLISDLDFDGVLLDVKPVYQDDDELIRLIRRVRSAVGLDAPIAVATPADLTPDAEELLELPGIAPGTMWSAKFKQRVMLTADELVMQVYQSYRGDVVDYVNWVAYHVQSYLRLLESDTRILVSVPHYASASAAHDPAVESLASALDGVELGLARLDAEQRQRLRGLAIFSDDALAPSLWQVFREHWIQR